MMRRWLAIGVVLLMAGNAVLADMLCLNTASFPSTVEDALAMAKTLELDKLCLSYRMQFTDADGESVPITPAMGAERMARLMDMLSEAGVQPVVYEPAPAATLQEWFAMAMFAKRLKCAYVIMEAKPENWRRNWREVLRISKLTLLERGTEPTAECGSWEKRALLYASGYAFAPSTSDGKALTMMDVESPRAPDVNEAARMQQVMALAKRAGWNGLIRVTPAEQDVFGTLKRQVLMLRACLAAPLEQLARGTVSLSMQVEAIEDTFCLFNPTADAVARFYSPERLALPAYINVMTECGGQHQASDAGFEDTESPEMAFDHNVRTKYGTPHRRPWLQFQFPNGQTPAVDAYALVSGNDCEWRDPVAWRLLASMDGISWVTVDEQKDVAWANRQELKVFKLRNTLKYNVLRLEIQAVAGDKEEFQLSEFLLYRKK